MLLISLDLSTRTAPVSPQVSIRPRPEEKSVFIKSSLLVCSAAPAVPLKKSRSVPGLHLSGSVRQGAIYPAAAKRISEKDQCRSEKIACILPATCHNGERVACNTHHRILILNTERSWESCRARNRPLHEAAGEATQKPQHCIQRKAGHCISCKDAPGRLRPDISFQQIGHVRTICTWHREES